jgi:hypothetical protein
MGALEVVQAVDLALALEMAGGIGKGLEALEEIAKRRFDMPFERLAVAAQELALAAFHPGKAQTVAQAGCLSRSSLFCRHILHQSAPKPMMPGCPMGQPTEFSHGGEWPVRPYSRGGALPDDP